MASARGPCPYVTAACEPFRNHSAPVSFEAVETWPRRRLLVVRMQQQPSCAGARVIRVLIVEDDRLIAWDIMQMVEAQGHCVVAHAATASRAVALALSLKPDVVLMDVRLQESDGISAARTIRYVQQTPIIFVTGYGDADTMSRISRFEDAPALLKPIDPHALEDAIRHAAGPVADDTRDCPS